MKFLDDIPADFATNAFLNISFSPDKRGEAYRQDYAQTLQADLEHFKAQALKGGTLEKLDEQFERYRNGYKRAFMAWLSAKSRCISSMISGPSNFPVRRAQKANQLEYGRLHALIEFRQKAKNAVIRNLRPDLRAIMSGDADALDRLSVDLAKREAQQERMKRINEIIRKNKAKSEADQIHALVELGVSEEQAAALIKPGHCCSYGFAGYELSNNNARIREIKKRMAHIEKMQSTPIFEKEVQGVIIQDDPPANRVRLIFSGKPEEAVRAELKKSGFRWSPSIGAWQAYRNHGAMLIAKRYLNAKSGEDASFLRS